MKIPNKIEIISLNYLRSNPEMVKELRQMNRQLALSHGWHYVLDWVWILEHVGEIENKTILDAGAGIGLLQWYLASKGGHVISVDRSDRTSIPFHLLRHFNISGYTPSDDPLGLKETINIMKSGPGLTRRIKSLARGSVATLDSANRFSKAIPGSVKLYRADLRSLSYVPDNHVDLVVSISALEHNQLITDVRTIVHELERVLKPGGMLLVTLPAAFETDWFFKEAYSWCFTESTLRWIFDLPEHIPSNFEEYGSILESIRNSSELKSHLSYRYYFLPKSGMPWGKWDPKYLPVGIVKTKQA